MSSEVWADSAPDPGETEVFYHYGLKRSWVFRDWFFGLALGGLVPSSLSLGGSVLSLLDIYFCVSLREPSDPPPDIHVLTGQS